MSHFVILSYSLCSFSFQITEFSENIIGTVKNNEQISNLETEFAKKTDLKWSKVHNF